MTYVLAQLKAAAYGLVALYGVAKAVRLIRDIANELEDSEWQGPGSR